MESKYDHVVMFSGGVCSWATAKRVVERHGTGRLGLVFADTLMEDEDLYRFLVEAVGNIFRSKVSKKFLPLSVPPMEQVEERREYLMDLGSRLMTEQPGFEYLAKGKTPWQIFEQEKMIGSHRFDPCSKHLKRILLDRFHRKNTDPSKTVLHFGLDW